jgi:hypothetical protein
MKLISKETYPQGYKPNIYMANLFVSYVENKYKESIKRNKELLPKYQKTITVINKCIVLDENNLFPSEKQYNQVLNQVLQEYTSKKEQDNNTYWIRSVFPQKHLGRVNYEFDKNKH